MPTFEVVIDTLRQEIKALAKKIKNLKESRQSGEPEKLEDIGEVIANLMLSYRHLEDASMRLGKVLQARAGGISTYDSNVVGDPREDGIKKNK
jgi:hypothetical protein